MDVTALRERLLSAIENGSVADVRALLAALPGSDGAQHADGADDDKGPGGGKSPTKALLQRKELVNVICPKRKMSALYFAVARRQCEIARELLNHGADPLWEFGPASSFVRGSCLDEAVSQRNVEMTRLLISSGTEVNTRSNHFLQLGKRDSFRTDLELVGVLSSDGRVPVPLLVASRLVKERDDMYANEEEAVRVRQNVRKVLLNNINWCFKNVPMYYRRIPRNVLGSPDCAFLLQQPARSLVQHFGKSLALQYLLVCGADRRTFPNKPGLSAALEAGANADGWTCGHTMAMLRAWMYTERNPECWERCPSTQSLNVIDTSLLGWKFHCFWHRRIFRNDLTCGHCHDRLLRVVHPNIWSLARRTRYGEISAADAGLVATLPKDPQTYRVSPLCLLPVISFMVRGLDHSLAKILLSHSRVSWLGVRENLPVSALDGNLILHDGPTCSDHAELSAKQKKISLMMCTCSGGTVQSLVSLCRDVITTACLEHTENVFFAVENLPLPRRMKYYLLGN